MFETPATFNDTWAYKSYDHNWKDPEGLIIRLSTIVSRGGNYLLNVGPMGDGVIPQPSVDNLRIIGEWMKMHGEAIYGVGPSPYKHELSWGGLTFKSGRLYCILVDWPESEVFELYGLANRVTAAGLLGSDDTLELTQRQVSDLGVDYLSINLPRERPSQVASVLWLDLKGEPHFDQSLLPVSGGKFRLDVSASERLPAADEEIVIDKFSTVTLKSGQALLWRVKFPTAGTFRVNLVTQMNRENWSAGIPYSITVGGTELVGQTSKHEVRDDVYSPSHIEDVITRTGEVIIKEPGTHLVEVQRTAHSRGSLKVRAVELLP
jgi:alpha-L-fucosidase